MSIGRDAIKEIESLEAIVKDINNSPTFYVFPQIPNA